MRTLALLLSLPLALFAADWPQWQGPNRDNINPEKGLVATFPAGGPKQLWLATDCGVGFSSPTTVGDRLYLLGTAGTDEVIHCLDVKTGKAAWPRPTVLGPIRDDKRGEGPRGSVTIDGALVYGMGGKGNLVCAEAATGKVVWAKHLENDLGGKVPTWGYSESPLIDGDLVICTPGGKNGTLAALDKKTGKVAWRSADLTDATGYSSPVVATVGGTRMYVQLTAGGVAGVAAKTGKLLWKEKVAVNNIAMIPTPLVHDGHVYVTSDYGSGCALVKLDATADGVTSKVVYENKVMQNHHGGFVLLDGHVYGASGNTNTGRPSWVCQDVKTGKEVWAALGMGEFGSLTVADGKLFLYGQDTGVLALVAPSPAGYKELGRFVIPAQSKLQRQQGKIWTHPVVANGRLYLRDLDLLYCFDVSAK